MTDTTVTKTDHQVGILPLHLIFGFNIRKRFDLQAFNIIVDQIKLC
jgi:hypothetical protein